MDKSRPADRRWIPGCLFQNALYFLLVLPGVKFLRARSYGGRRALESAPVVSDKKKGEGKFLVVLEEKGNEPLGFEASLVRRPLIGSLPLTFFGPFTLAWRDPEQLSLNLSGHSQEKFALFFVFFSFGK